MAHGAQVGFQRRQIVWIKEIDRSGLGLEVSLWIHGFVSISLPLKQRRPYLTPLSEGWQPESVKTGWQLSG
jgi:hypothetical protein